MRKLQSLTRNKVIALPTPEQTNTYQPVSYQTLITGADRVADQYQFTLDREEFETDIHGGKIKMKFFYNDGMSNNGFQLSVLTSHDKSLSVRAAGGIFSHICWNLNMIGDIQLLHRHQADVNEEIETFLNQCFSSHQQQHLLADKLEQELGLVPLNKREMAELIGRAFVDEKIIGVNQLSLITKELDKPSFKYHNPESLWGLYNHFTNAVKSEHPLTYMQTQQKIQKFFTDVQVEYI